MCSLTLDNDIAFAHHETLSKALAIPIYFCEPYKSYQKGSYRKCESFIASFLASAIEY
ncbi:hypothetical protein [Coxiella burnetii]|uniref:hypothetical protein n=1 Tax=Coxiella burnetii TaxID=777 RepID=UPI0003103270|nr:hypothetical protein [Coxiella burnetii]